MQTRDTETIQSGNTIDSRDFSITLIKGANEYEVYNLETLDAERDGFLKTIKCIEEPVKQVNEITQTVYAVAKSPYTGDVWIVGDFINVGDLVVNRVARYDGERWHAVDGGVDNRVHCIAFASNGDVYIGGVFLNAGETPVTVNRIARLDHKTQRWVALDTGMNNNVFTIYMSPLDDGTMYIGGAFTTAGGISASRIVKYTGRTWVPVTDDGGNGLNNTVFAITMSVDGELYIGGQFITAAGKTHNRIVKYHLGKFQSVSVEGMDNPVYCLRTHTNGDVYAGGWFTSAGGVACNYVAKWDGEHWHPVAENKVNGKVFWIEIANNRLYVGGEFGEPGQKIASVELETQETTALSSGFDNTVRGFFVKEDELWAGGMFTQPGNKLAVYTDGSWETVQSRESYISITGDFHNHEDDIKLYVDEGAKLVWNFPLMKWVILETRASDNGTYGALASVHHTSEMHHTQLNFTREMKPVPYMNVTEKYKNVMPYNHASNGFVIKYSGEYYVAFQMYSDVDYNILTRAFDGNVQMMIYINNKPTNLKGDIFPLYASYGCTFSGFATLRAGDVVSVWYGNGTLIPVSNISVMSWFFHIHSIYDMHETGSGEIVPIQPSRQQTRGMWVWKTTEFFAEDISNTIDLLRNASVDAIYLYVRKDEYTTKEQDLRRVVSMLKENGVSVYGMDGYRGYLSDVYGPQGLYDTVDAMLAYNNRVSENETFAGFSVDNEPQDSTAEPEFKPTFHNGKADSQLSTVPGSGVWKDTEKDDRDFLMRDWIDIQKTVFTKMRNNGMKVSAAIVSWLTDYFGEPVFCTYNGVYGPVYSFMMDYVDEYIIMSYNTNPVNAMNRILGIASYALSRKNNVPKIYGALETHPGVGANISYADTPGKQSKAIVLSDIEIIQDTLKEYNVANVCIHDWYGWKTLPA